MNKPLITSTLVLALAACSDSPSQVEDNKPPTATALAYVELVNNRPALFIQGANEASPRQIHFDGTAEDLPGNDPRVPKLADANILAIRSPRWSPDGSRLAFVASTAFDQAELIVANADGTHPRIVSVSSQYVMGDVDWSADGKYLAYAMSTRPGAQGLELFISDVDNRTYRQITQSSGYSGLGGVVRFNTTGTHIYFSRVVGEESTAPFNWITDIRRVSAAGGTVETVKANLVGNVQSIERSGAAVLIMRATGWPPDGRIPRELSRVSLTGSPPLVLATGTSLQVAHFTQDDGFALILTDSSTSGGSPYSYQIIPAVGGTPAYVRGVTDASGGMDVRISK